MTETVFRVVTKGDGSSWVYRDDRPYAGPFLSRHDALVTSDALVAGLLAFPDAKAVR